MVDKKTLAQHVYRTVCAALEARKWNFEKDEPELVVHFGVRGDDLPMKLIIKVDEDRQLIRVMSPMPFKMDESRLAEGAVAACAASYGMVEGNFDYDISDGSIVFRMTASFRESLIGVELIQYMISCTCSMVDKYNDMFLALSKGMLSLEEFMKKA